MLDHSFLDQPVEDEKAKTCLEQIDAEGNVRVFDLCEICGARQQDSTTSEIPRYTICSECGSNDKRRKSG